VLIGLLAIALRMAWMLAGALMSRLGRLREPVLSANVIALLGWSGMRGVLSLVTALAVPRFTASGAPFPGRANILFYAFSVIVMTLIVQGLPLPYVIRWLRIPRDEPRREEELLARVRTARAARDRLDRFLAEEQDDQLVATIALDLRARYQRLLENLESQGEGAGRIHVETARLRRELAHAQRVALLDLRGRRLIDDETYRRIERELDLEEQSS
jgi:CPA1 family monovalent cation:H+ antiporter